MNGVGIWKLAREKREREMREKREREREMKKKREINERVTQRCSITGAVLSSYYFDSVSNLSERVKLKTQHFAENGFHLG
jgi:diphthamide synthase (EF-2-diphthine--ammonia ligase)